MGAFEAKTHLARLLDEVARGETIEITKHGVPVARLVPPTTEVRPDIGTVIAEIKKLRTNVGALDKQQIMEIRDEGRRH